MSAPPPPRWLSSARGRRFANPEVIGTGAGGTVYRTFDHERNGVVAVKGLREPNPDSVAGLKREFRALNRLQHPNLLQLHELLYWDGEWLLTMECIDGQNFLEWVRPGYQSHRAASRDTSRATPADPSPTGAGSASHSTLATGVLDEARLRDALGQLVLGLDVVHRSGRLHRDIKPSNVLVTNGGRVVLCDFGLVTEMQAAASGAAVVGTPSYMSPEQAAGAPLGAASDLYAVGVMLYEALAGLRPFAGESEEIMQRKQRVVPVSPGQLASTRVPVDLEHLAMRLLSIDPAQRPTASDVRAALGEPLGPPPLAAEPPFVGRVAALATMHGVLGRVRTSGRGHSLLVQGPAGIGKSALLRQFADEVASSEEANVLMGACYEREFVPHRALDEVMDALSTHLRATDVDLASILEPEELQPLLTLFPMLARVPGLTVPPLWRGHEPATLDPREIRQRAFEALRRLITTTGHGKPWLMIVDDLQWGDEESLPILSALLGHPATTPLLFVGAMSVPEDDADTGPAHQEMMRRPQAFGGVTRIDLDVLTRDDTERLASSWLGETATPELTREIAKRAKGIPSEVRKLADRVSSGQTTLDGAAETDAVEARIRGLTGEASRLLSALSLATHRETLRVLLRALGGLANQEHALATLRRHDLVRAIPAGQEVQLEVSEDRVRATARARLGPDERVNLHLALHAAVSAIRPTDYETQLFHARAAGLHGLASEHALSAAAAAQRALRFERGARFAQMAVQVLPHEQVSFAMRRTLAEALALAGRGAEAGRAYVRAADSAPTDALAQECRRIGAGHLLRSGYLDEGEAAMNAQLAALGADPLDVPDGLVSRVVAAATARSRQVLGGHERGRGDIGPEAELVDTLWEAVTGLALVDPARAGWLQLRHQRHARRLGDPGRLARALWSEAVMTGLRGRGAPGELDGVLARAVSLTPGDPDARARMAVLQPLVRGVLSLAAGEYPMARGQLARALRVARERGPAQAWDIAVAETHMLWAMAQLGELRTMSTRIQALLADAEPRADRFFESMLTTGPCTLAKLAEGDPAEVLRRAERARHTWERHAAPLPCALADLGTVYAHLYRGDTEQAEQCAHTMLGADLPRARLGVQHLDAELAFARGLAALATARAPHSPMRHRQALTHVERSAAAIRAHAGPPHHVLSRLLDGLALTVKRREPEAMVALREAEGELRRRGMATLATVTRAAHGVALGGDAGAAFVEQARHDLRAFGAQHPDALLSIWMGPRRPE
ncbi:MAG: AAA family ATPase [Sandaracinaceae bacterium]|nr:AAA family ATPase [Sandaracinaceae bacterium]